MARYIYPLRNTARRRCFGAKADSLLWLLRHGYPVPETWVCCWNAYEMHERGDRELRARLETELEAIVDPRRSYAVRSSANLEDGGDISFAGQFTSVLDVRGRPHVLSAIETVFSSTRNPKVLSYLEAHRIPQEQLRMGVIIQEMVEPEVSGVSFSRNPVTGLDEVVVEAVEGRGDLLLQEGCNPHRWIHKWGSFIQIPATGEIADTLIEGIVRRTRRIEKQLGKPVDIEWVFGGGSVYLVQVRPLGQTEDLSIYSNRISREFLPGQIKPLVWSINVPLVNGAWIDLFHRLIGPTSLRPEHLAEAFYYRAYFNMGAVGTIFQKLGFPRESLELLMGIEGGEEKPRMRPSLKSIRYLPRLLWFLGTKLWYRRTVKRAVHRADAEYRELLQLPITELEDAQLLERVDRLFGINKRLAFHNIVAPLFMSLFTRLLQRKFEKSGLHFELFDLKAGVKELAGYDPNPELHLLRQRLAALPSDTQAAIRSGSYRRLLGLEGCEVFRAEVTGFINHFGHLSDSGNDFSSTPWRENPDLVLRMICDPEAPKESKNTAR